MKMGAERKKIVILVALVVVAIVVYFINSTGSETGPPSAQRPPAAGGTPSAVVRPPADNARDTTQRAGRGRASSTEFRPSMRPRRGEERPDPTTIDPTLRLDLLARLQQVKVEGPRRSLFDFGQPEAPKPDPKEVAAAKKPVPSPLVPEEAKDKPKEPEPPKAPPVPMKFYGYLSRSATPAKRAFFIEGEEIHVVSEGDLVNKRYKIVRIGVNSVVVEDTQFKQEQTVPLLEEQPG
jgi:hypothetical protein